VKIEIQNDEGVFQEITTLERNLPDGVGGELLKAVMTECETIERRENLPGPEGGLSQ